MEALRRGPPTSPDCMHCGTLKLLNFATLLALRSRFGFLHFLDERGNDVEEVADDGVVGDFEDRRLRIFIDGENGARPFHADNVLDGAADAQREIELGSDGLSGRTDLAIHG